MLILKNISELAKDVISKNLIVSEVFLKKVLEFLLRHQISNLQAMFLLMPLLNYCFIEKQSGKKDLIWLISSSGFEIVHILLKKK